MEELEKIDILSLTKEELTGQITAMGEKAFRAKQIYDWLHVKKVSDFSQMSNISAQFREELSRKFCLKHLIIKKKLVSALDNTVKYIGILGKLTADFPLRGSGLSVYYGMK